MLRAAGVVLKKDNKYLLVQEKKQIVFGLWNWPGGRIDEGETAERCAVREAMEEVSLNIRLVKSLGEWPTDSSKGDSKMLFLGEIIDGVIAIKEDELLDARWFTKDEILGMKDKLRSQWVAASLEQGLC